MLIIIRKKCNKGNTGNDSLDPMVYAASNVATRSRSVINAVGIKVR